MPLIHASDRPRPGRPLQGQHRLQRVQRRLAVGRIYERRGFSDAVRFFWSLHGVVLTRPPDTHTDGHEPILEMAKARLKRSWDRWLEWSERTEAE